MVEEKKGGEGADEGTPPEVLSFRELDESVRRLVERCVLKVLEGEHFSSAKVPKFVDDINALVLKRLKSACKDFKYIVTCAIAEAQRGAGFHLANSHYWDSETDGSLVVSWEDDEFICAVTVFGLAL